MLDIHTHLYFEAFDADREAVIQRARAAGIRQIIVVGCDPVECRQAVDLTRLYPEIYASVGIHPNEFRTGGAAAKRDLLELMTEPEAFAADEKVVAIGECGLDYSKSHGGIDPDTKARQHAGLMAHLELAEKLKLPVIIHCRPSHSSSPARRSYASSVAGGSNETGKPSSAGRDAYEDLLEILKAKSQKLKAAILHCYMGDTGVTQEFLELPNLYFSFTGNITYPVKKHLQGTKDDLTETVRLIPKERIFIETDCPFLAPQAKRGERNEPAYAIHTAEKACELLGLTRALLDEALQENFRRVFSRAN